MITAEDEPIASPGGGPSLGAESAPPPSMTSGAPVADPDEGRVSIPVTTPGGGLRAAPLPDGPAPLGLPVVLAPISPIGPQRQRPRPTRAPLGEPRGTLRTRLLHQCRVCGEYLGCSGGLCVRCGALESRRLAEPEREQIDRGADGPDPVSDPRRDERHLR